MEIECDTSKSDTSPFDSTPLTLGAKRERRTPMTLSQEPLRYCAREPQSRKREQIGFEKMNTMKAQEETATKTRTAAAYATKLKLSRQGLTCFGPMDGAPLVSEEGGGPIWNYNACTFRRFPMLC